MIDILAWVVTTALVAAGALVVVLVIAKRPLIETLDPRVRVVSIVAAYQSTDPDSAIKDLFAWERERVLGVAKGLGGAAAGLIVAIAPVLLKGEITEWAAPLLVIVLAGVATALVLAARTVSALNGLSDELAFCLALAKLQRM